MNAMLFGAEADSIRHVLEDQPKIRLVNANPDVVICYGGDGTLLTSELRWPGIPKVPIRNSRRGIRCIPHPPEEVIQRLVTNTLCKTQFIKLECSVFADNSDAPRYTLTAMNEFNLHMGHINSAVRVKVWLNDEPYANGAEIIGDGFILSTPFGSTAYFNQITRGVFYSGLGIAFKNTTDLTSHVIMPEDHIVRALITRGPAVLAYDNAPEYVDLNTGDRLELRRHSTPATIYTWDTMSHPCDEF